MRIERNGHVYDTEKSTMLGIRRYLANTHGGELTTEKLYRTMSGAYFVLGANGQYAHRVKTSLFRAETYTEMIIPVGEEAAERWLKEHCGRSICEKKTNTLIHPSISVEAKKELQDFANRETGGHMGAALELILERMNGNV